VSSVSTGISTSGVKLAAGSGAGWSAFSAREAKENLAEIDVVELVRRLAAIPITTWNYKSQDPSIRHIGPMAQDFHSAFRVGEEERFIAQGDADGVALAAIQGLYSIMQEKECEIANLREREASKDERIEKLEARLAKIEAMLGHKTADAERK